jgi:polyferredoxin
MLFFVWAIVTMSADDLKSFIYGDYNKVADVMMLMFFIKISAFSLGVIIALAVFSLFIKNFWCRYLCPYGAFLGFFSIFSPLKITRNPDTCTDCRHCTQACPQNIQVHSKIRIRSDECMACYQCVTACPEIDTLKMRLNKKSKKEIPAKLYAAIIIGIFLLFTTTAMITGHWKNNIKREEYMEWIPKLDSINLEHTN